jgi:Holliday junction resolvase RusA-like endonuclease
MSSLTLPWPPSTNSLFTNRRGGRSATPAYKAWQEDAGWTLQAQHPERHAGPVAVTVELRNPTKRKADADNRLKAVLDLLVKHQVIAADDSTTLRSVTARWVDIGEPCTVIIVEAA